MKKIAALFISISLILFPVTFTQAYSAPTAPEIEAPSAVLMEKSTGCLLYEKDAYTHRSPASVTKIMTMLLICEAVSSGRISLDDSVTASANAAGMGGSQIWLEQGESLSVEEMLKCISVVSANDCCVAMAEYMAGSEDAFVDMMNERARDLGLEHSHFTCCSGLTDSQEHYSCAYDLALISRELLKYDFIKDYTCIWVDHIRDGQFTLNNTNKLIYHYPGATGLKTGFTGKAMHCLAASAQRDGTEYIAVVLGAESSAKRFDSARALLDFAFANYELIPCSQAVVLPPVKVKLGSRDCVSLYPGGSDSILVPKNCDQLRFETELPSCVSAPVEQGRQLGTLKVYAGQELLSVLPLLSCQSAEPLSLADIVSRLLLGLNRL